MTTAAETAGPVQGPPVPCQDLLEDLLDALNNCPPEPTGLVTQGKLLSRFGGLRIARQRAEALADALKKVERIEELTSFDFLEGDDVKSVNHDLGRFVRVIMIQGSVPKEARDEFLQWAEDAGMFEAMTTLQIRKAAINDLAKQIDKGEHDDVPGLGVFTTKQLRFTPHK